MDAELARLVSVSKSIHRAPAPAGKAGSFTVPSFASLPSPKPSKVSKPPKPLPVQPTRKRKAPDVPATAKAAAASEDASQGTKFARPPRAERDLFMSASASRIHERAAPEPERGVGKGIGSAAAVAQRHSSAGPISRRWRTTSRCLAARAAGLVARTRRRESAHSGLQPEKPHKRPCCCSWSPEKAARPGRDRGGARPQGGNTARKQTAELAAAVSPRYTAGSKHARAAAFAALRRRSAAGGVLSATTAPSTHTKNKGKGKGGGGGARAAEVAGGGRGRGRGRGRR